MLRKQSFTSETFTSNTPYRLLVLNSKPINYFNNKYKHSIQTYPEILFIVQHKI